MDTKQSYIQYQLINMQYFCAGRSTPLQVSTSPKYIVILVGKCIQNNKEVWLALKIFDYFPEIWPNSFRQSNCSPLQPDCLINPCSAFRDSLIVTYCTIMIWLLEGREVGAISCRKWRVFWTFRDGWTKTIKRHYRTQRILAEISSRSCEYLYGKD